MTQPSTTADRHCPVCGVPFTPEGLVGHLEQEHRDGGGVNPPPATGNKAWPPAGMETKSYPTR